MDVLSDLGDEVVGRLTSTGASIEPTRYPRRPV